jgi:hypothetical protein
MHHELTIIEVDIGSASGKWFWIIASCTRQIALISVTYRIVEMASEFPQAKFYGIDLCM